MRSESSVRILKDKCSLLSMEIRSIYIKCPWPTSPILFVKHALVILVFPSVALGSCANCCFRALAVFLHWSVLSPQLLNSFIRSVPSCFLLIAPIWLPYVLSLNRFHSTYRHMQSSWSFLVFMLIVDFFCIMFALWGQKLICLLHLTTKIVNGWESRGYRCN